MIGLNEWYTRQEVADKLGVSKNTVYHYAKQGKIIKIDDPHRVIREARYHRKEVDELIEERTHNRPLGMRPSALAKQLDVPVSKIYNVIKENKLPVDEFPLGDEMKGYSISLEMAERIKEEIERATPMRGRRTEFYDSEQDISLYQLFRMPNGQDIRVVRNEDNEWGFTLQSRAWLTLEEGLSVHRVYALYDLHQVNIPVKGYTDFILDKKQHESFVFLDFVYQNWGIENIRLRDMDDTIALSIKSGERKLKIPLPESLPEEWVSNAISEGGIEKELDTWVLFSGYQKTSISLPVDLRESVIALAKEHGITMNDFIEATLRSAVVASKK